MSDGSSWIHERETNWDEIETVFSLFSRQNNSGTDERDDGATAAGAYLLVREPTERVSDAEARRELFHGFEEDGVGVARRNGLDAGRRYGPRGPGPHEMPPSPAEVLGHTAQPRSAAPRSERRTAARNRQGTSGRRDVDVRQGLQSIPGKRSLPFIHFFYPPDFFEIY